jgi:hypothetical protein
MSKNINQSKELIIQENAEKFQNDTLKIVKEMIDLNPKLEHQDCVNVLLYRKIAELEYEIQSLKRISRNSNMFY